MSRRGVKPLRLSLGSEEREGSKLKHGVEIVDSAIAVELRELRRIVESSISKNLFENAVFFANKLVTLSGGRASDVYLLAQAYFLAKQYRRAVHLIQQHGLLEKVDFVLLAVQCLMESNQHEEAQNALEMFLGEANIEKLRTRAKTCSDHSPCNPIAALCLLRGRVYETLDNRPRATVWYKAALFCDIYCYEAFDALIDNQLKPSEERQLMSELQRYGLFDDNSQWLKAVYASRLSKHDYTQPIDDRFHALNLIVPVDSSPEEDGKRSGLSENVDASNKNTAPFLDPKTHNLGNDLDCAAEKAECMYQQHDAQGAYQVTKKIRLKDPYHLRCITVHLASLVQLVRKSELFHTAHNLVEYYPSHAVSWFAVGCYYYCINKFDAARRFFHKATNMDASLAVAWLAFGHSFAALDESDQAIAAYRTASRLFIGSHLPVLCTAVEYLRTNNVTLAEQFCRQAKSMCATDPFVLNELGVVYYRQQRYANAAECFQEALKLCRNQPERLRYAWEPAIFNLAHCYRKLQQYDQAIHFYELALSYSPKEASTYSALGLTYHAQGRLQEAIENYHNALGLKPEDTFSSEMLDKALTESFTLQIKDDPLLSLDHNHDQDPTVTSALSFNFTVTKQN